MEKYRQFADGGLGARSKVISTWGCMVGKSQEEFPVVMRVYHDAL